jgi:hypothetical protein
MKFDLRHAIVAALALGAAGSASAIDITTVPAANILYASGSTAIEAALKAYFYNKVDTSTLCDSTAGTIDVYAQGTGAPSKFTAVACQSNAALVNDGAGGSVPIAIIKESNAGSLNGVTALQNIAFSGSPYTDGHLNFPTVAQLTTANCPGTAKAATTTLQAFTNHACTGFVVNPVVPQLGFADVEGTLFSNTDPTTPVALLSGPTVQVVFAPVVSLGLYHALQAVEGKTVGSDLAVDMPSLTRPQLSAIYSGKVPAATGWNWLKNSAGAAVGSQSVTYGAATGSCYNGAGTSVACTTPSTTTFAPASTNVYICRRGANSGSEKSAEVYVNDFGCGAGTYAFQAPSVPAVCTTSATDGCGWTQATAVSKLVFPGNGTGDLLDCINGHDSAGHFAIGFASTDNLSGSSQSNAKRTDFRYIRVDGIVPSIENAAAGKYPFVSQSFWYAPPQAQTWSALNGSGAVADAMLTVITTNTTQAIGTVGSVVGVNAASVNVAQGFDGGVLVIPGTNGSVPSAANATAATFATNPVSAVWKTQGSSTNNCVRAMQYPAATEVAADGNPAWGGPL